MAAKSVPFPSSPSFPGHGIRLRFNIFRLVCPSGRLKRSVRRVRLSETSRIAVGLAEGKEFTV